MRHKVTNSIDDMAASPMLRFLVHLANSFSRILGILSCSFLVLAVILNCANVFGRYVLAAPIIWAEEAMSFCVIGSVFCAVPVLAWKGRHMRMDIVPNLLPGQVRGAVELVTDALLAVFVLAFAIFAGPLLAQIVSTGEKSEAMGLPMIVPHAVVTAGMVLMGAAFLMHAVVSLLRFRTDPGNR
jgi:TRAP-type C4-dicarboxylate transport system permease small subunit